MPPDPFANDPNDPASFLDNEEEFPPLTPEEQLQVELDLHLLYKFRQALEPRGIKGILFFCEECEENHYYDWDIMAANMQAILNNELAAVHEPSAEPSVLWYVPWDYCIGYLDGLAASTSDS
ncbi:hypothetical protein CFREI_02220 [Corynebacterium freiburgense]|nr:hypothetical protein CFREI_02220 [Corynebacterium freiburgense]